MAKEHKLKGFADHRSCCAVSKYREGDCKVIFPNRAGQWICLSGTAYQNNHNYPQKLCDLMFLWNSSSSQFLSSVLELKGGGVDISGAVQQLQNGARIVDELAAGLDMRFLPVLVHRRLAPVQVEALKKGKIRFRGRSVPISLLRCGGKVSDLIW